MKTIAICNQKGGVGKTTTTVNLGTALAKMGKRVLLVDSDPQHSMTDALGVPGKENLATLISDLLNNQEPDTKAAIQHHIEGVDFIGTDETLESVAELMSTKVGREYYLDDILHPLRFDYDYCLVDCRPTIDTLPINALATANSVLIPVQTKGMSVNGMELLFRSISNIQKRINKTLRVEGILFTMITHDNESISVKKHIRERYSKFHIFDTEIPNTTNISKVFNEQKSALSLKNNKGSEAYKKLAEEIEGLI